MALQRIVEPDVEPVTVDEVKAYCRVSDSAEDAVFGVLIAAARDMAQNELRRSLITQTWQLTLDAFPVAFELQYPRAISVSSVRYIDTDGVWTTINPVCYTLDNKAEPAWLVPADGYTWPDTDDVLNSVVVTYTAGYGAAADSVPDAIKLWTMAQVAHRYRNREAAGESLQQSPFLRALLDPYRVPTLP
jgi:uncharacterized phiE125 gp8 family phage protein